MRERRHFFIGGRWVAAAGTDRITVENPASEEPLGSIPEGGVADAAHAVAAACAAFADWRERAPSERAGYLQRIRQGLEARAAELGLLIAEDVGQPIRMARRMQVGLPIEIFRLYERILPEFRFEERVGHSRVRREPVGVIVCITPWNYPLFQIAAKVAPALAAGCTVVVKPSEVAPLSAFVLAEIIEEARLPPGVFNLVTGSGPGIGEALVSHPDVDMISFTGSTAVGRRIGELAGRGIKRTTLELGGKSATVVLDDADLAAAVRATVNSCFLNSGQTCLALTRLLVPEGRYDEAAGLAVSAAKRLTLGDPLEESTKLGPLVSRAQRERVARLIRTAVAEGAELLLGGAERPQGFPRGHYVEPTVLGRVRSHSTAGQEEIFGPVLSLLTYADDADAVRIANDTQYGLAGAVWSATEERALRVAMGLRVGQVDINGAAFNLLAPFGGCKRSGTGRELGRYGLEEFLEYRSFQMPDSDATAKPQRSP